MNRYSIPLTNILGCTWRISRLLTVTLVSAWALISPAASPGAQLKKDTVIYWDAYVDAARPQLDGQKPFLWVDQQAGRLQRVREGEVLVSPFGKETPNPIESGLIYDWIGAAFVPGANINDIMAAVRDYRNYKDYYKPTVADSKLIATYGPCEKYSMRVVNKEVVSETALDMEYETCYHKIDEHRWYSITQTTKVQELRHYGRSDEEELPPDHGTGFIWRLYSVAKYEQRDGGTYIEVEAIALSRDIPVGLRWIVSPIIRRVSKNSLLLSLQETKDAVQLIEAAKPHATLPTTADNGFRGGPGSGEAIANRLVCAAIKP